MPIAFRFSAIPAGSPQITPHHRSGGGDRTRTDDPLLAKQVLYQLSYDPKLGGSDVIKNDTLKIYFVRSIETQKTADFRLQLPSTIGAITHVMLPSP